MSKVANIPRRRRWLTFSLRTFLIASTLASLGIWGFVSWYWQPEGNEEILPGGLLWRAQTKEIAGGMPGQTYPTPHGEFTLVDRHGRTLITGRNVDGLPDGRWTHFHTSRRIALSGKYVRGVPTKVWTAWDERGRKRLEVTYESRDETIAGFPPPATATLTVSHRSGTSREWWANGCLKSEGELREDLREGVWTFWDEGGWKSAAGPYRRGVRHGEWQLQTAAKDKPRLVWYVKGQAIENGDELLAQLSKQVRSGDGEARFEAVEALGDLGDPAVSTLANVLATDDVPLALCTLRALKEIGPPAKAALPAISKLRTSPHAKLRRESLLALFSLDEADRRSIFRELLLEADLHDLANCREWHLRLSELGPAALPEIGRALDDSELSVRLRALHVLALRVAPNSLGWYEGDDSRKHEAAWKLLEKAQRDPDEGISRTAKEILETSKRLPWVDLNEPTGPGCIGFLPIIG